MFPFCFFSNFLCVALLQVLFRCDCPATHEPLAAFRRGTSSYLCFGTGTSSPPRSAVVGWTASLHPTSAPSFSSPSPASDESDGELIVARRFVGHGHRYDVNAVVSIPSSCGLSQGRPLLASGSDDATICLWSATPDEKVLASSKAQSQMMVLTSVIHENAGVLGLLAMSDGRRLLSCSADDQPIVVRDLVRGAITCRVNHRQSASFMVMTQLAPDVIAAAGFAKVIQIYDIRIPNTQKAAASVSMSSPGLVSSSCSSSSSAVALSFSSHSESSASSSSSASAMPSLSSPPSISSSTSLSSSSSSCSCSSSPSSASSTPSFSSSTLNPSLSPAFSFSSWDFSCPSLSDYPGKCLQSLRGHRDFIVALDVATPLSFVPSPSLVPSSSSSSASANIVPIAYDLASSLLLSGSYDTMVKVFDLRTYRLLRSMGGDGSNAGIHSLIMAPSDWVPPACAHAESDRRQAVSPIFEFNAEDKEKEDYDDRHDVAQPAQGWWTGHHLQCLTGRSGSASASLGFRYRRGHCVGTSS